METEPGAKWEWLTLVNTVNSVNIKLQTKFTATLQGTSQLHEE